MATSLPVMEKTMANIRKHRDKWQAQIRLKGIKPITKSFVKRSDAMRWARAVEGEITVGTYVDPRKAETTLLASVIDQYLAQIEERGVKDNARRSRLGRLRGRPGRLCAQQANHQHIDQLLR